MTIASTARFRMSFVWLLALAACGTAGAVFAQSKPAAQSAPTAPRVVERPAVPSRYDQAKVEQEAQHAQSQARIEQANQQQNQNNQQQAHQRLLEQSQQAQGQ